ncbi:MAG: DEAD/DEAH box helicase [Gammaproteobacteria bacterium]|nr:DEAD/DEAH box helicase [Gammaproteobacteria bacterium]
MKGILPPPDDDVHHQVDQLVLEQGEYLPWNCCCRRRRNISNVAAGRRIRSCTRLGRAPPAGLRTGLRPYQQRGLDWLQFLREHGFGGILADDMGLGKTVQALAHLLREKEAGRADRPSLVVAPTSLMFNWRHEARRFAPDLRVLVLHGPRRKARFAAIGEHDLVLTTYPLLARDKDALLAQPYHLAILDEAQFIKNPRAQASRVARRIEARHRLCLTGTPLENHLGELWSLFDFAAPGLLGSDKQFRRLFRTPIEKHDNEAAMDCLTRRVRPFLLRRTKAQAAAELPEKTEIVQSVALENQQRELYETVRLAVHRQVYQAIERRGLARSHVIVLDALLKLRQVCCDPRLVDMDEARAVTQSAKLTMLMTLLPEMIEEGRRVLVFSQFTSMLALIEAALQELGLGYAKLTGRTRNRQAAVERFQAGEVPVFLISLKAGGTGLNLTAADTVIHYDPWWNPAVERQAADRAHRIGQDQPVFIYKLICEGTLEEKIQRLQRQKDALAEGLHRHGGTGEPRWTEQDLEALFQPLGDRA